MAADPFDGGVTHATNRQYNRQNPAFADRPPPGAHLASNAQWPEPQRWHSGPEDLTEATLAKIEREGREGDRLHHAPAYDLALSPALLLASLGDDAKTIRELLARGAWIECRTESGATPVICAASKGAGMALEALLDAGADITAVDKVGANVVHLAAHNGRVATIQNVFAHEKVTSSDGAKEALLRWPTNGGETPIMAAAKAGHDDVVRVLIELMSGKAIASRLAGPEDDKSGLELAKEKAEQMKREKEAAEKAGVDPGEKKVTFFDDGGDVARCTAMSLACRAGHVKCVQALLDGGANPVERSGPRGMTPLMHAACKAQSDVVEKLLKKPEVSADVEAKDDAGMSALLHAAAAGCPGTYQQIARLWTGGENDTYDERDAKGRTPLALAARFGGKRMVEYVIEKAGVIACGEFDDQNESPLFAAIKGGFVGEDDAAELIFRAYPVHERKLEVMEIKSNEGMTMLLWAAAHGRDAACEWLVKNGANLLATDKKGRLPRQTAEQHGKFDTSALLSQLAKKEWLRL